MTDEEMMDFLRAGMLDAREPMPSVETPLHSVLPFRYIVHTHDFATQALTDNPRPEATVRAPRTRPKPKLSLAVKTRKCSPSNRVTVVMPPPQMLFSRSAKKSVRPLNGAAGSRGAVRASSTMWVASCAFVFQTLRPWITYRSP